MTCQSSESTDTIDGDGRAHSTSTSVGSDESRIASAMKDLRNTGTSDHSSSVTLILRLIHIYQQSKQEEKIFPLFLFKV